MNYEKQIKPSAESIRAFAVEHFMALATAEATRRGLTGLAEITEARRKTAEAVVNRVGDPIYWWKQSRGITP